MASCGCSPVPLALARPPALARDPGGRQRALEAAKNRQLQERGDLQAVTSAGGPPPCRPSLGPPAKARPECPVARVAVCGEPADDYKDCKCAVKGACKKAEGSCKRVRFSDEVLPEEASSAGPAQPLAACTRASPPSPPAPRWACEPHERVATPPPPPASSEGRDKDRTSVSSHGPCDCPCWAAYSPSPPSTLATGDIYRTCRLPKRFQYPVWFTGYNTGPKHPLYRTTSADIGRHAPTVHTVPTIFRPVDRTTSKIYVPAGPWRNRSLCNTGSIWEVYSYNNFY